MNYYPHHIGDYITATAHLSMVEDGAYRRLLDLYYSSEKQLPLDRKALYRLVRARSPEEQEAVDIVTEEFFIETGAGWFHARCDEEIEKARVISEKARANGKKGGRPPKQQPKNNPEETQPVNSGLADENPEETQGKANVKPPIPLPNPNKEKHTSARADFAGTRFQEFWEAWPRTDRRTAKAECLKRWKLRGLDAHADEILLHLTAMKTTKKWLDGFEPAPLTYLNQRHWEDGIPLPATPHGNGFSDLLVGAI